MFDRFSRSAVRRSALPGLAALLLVAPVAGGAGLPPGLDAETKAALAQMPSYTPPSAYSEDLVITADGRTMTMKRFIDGTKIRSDMNANGQDIIMVEMGDADGTMLTIDPKGKRAMKMTMKAMTGQAPEVHGEPDTTQADNTPPAGYKVEYLGEETLDGVATKKFRMTTADGSALGWFDAATGAPVRMEGTSDGKPAVIEWKNVKVEPQAAALFEVPKGYEVTDMDAMRAQMKAMGGMGNMMKNMAGGMMGGLGQNLGSQLGGVMGGPLGAMAGNYLGGRVGRALGHKAAE
jgi:outer membrane lipoprotein-sorting protein